MAVGENPCAGCQEVTEEEMLAQLDDVLSEYVDTPGALIPVLQITQSIFGYLPEAALRKISVALNKPYSEVAGVVGFYSFFTTVPRGRHIVRVCMGTACYVRGGKEVLSALRAALRVEVGETTSDRLFSLDVGTMLRSVRAGAGHHDRRRRASARPPVPGSADSRTVSRGRRVGFPRRQSDHARWTRLLFQIRHSPVLLCREIANDRATGKH